MQETLFQTIVSPDALKECIRREPAVLIWFTGPGCRPRVSLPRERFWDIPVPKIDSPTRQPLLPR
ncbi:MAG: hypothetical protein AB2814_07575, partial [Candidatus Sedimenticola endophacoides]